MYKLMKKLLEEVSDLEKAQNPATSSEDLAQLADHDDPEIVRKVASNPNTPTKTLGSLMLGGYHKEVLDNPVIPLLKLENPDYLNNLIGSEDWDAIDSVAGLNNPELLHILSDHSDSAVRDNIAKNKNTHPDTLDKLANDSNEYVQNSVSKNKNTHENTLDKLGNLKKSFINRGIIYNPNASSNVLHKIYQQIPKTNFDLIKVIAAHPNTNADVLADLSNSSISDYKRMIINHPNTNAETLHKFGSDPKPDTRAAVARHPNAHIYTLKALSADNDPKVRAAVAQNANTPPDLLEKFSKDPDFGTRRAVAINNNAGDNLLNNLKNDEDEYVRQFAQYNLDNKLKK